MRSTNFKCEKTLDKFIIEKQKNLIIVLVLDA